MSRMLNPAVSLAYKMPGKIGNLAAKGFGNMVYDKGLSMYKGLDYQLIKFQSSVASIEVT